MLKSITAFAGTILFATATVLFGAGVANADGQMLFANGRRSNPFPLSREKAIDALAAVDDLSFKEHGVLLSALVVHFWDDGITHRFYEKAILNGLLSPDADEDERQAFETDCY